MAGMYIWERPDWPNFTYNSDVIAQRVAEVAREQGRLYGRLSSFEQATQDRAAVEVLTADVVKTSAIEGELLDVASVRSSVARRLGVDIGATDPSDRRVDGVVEMILDATRDYASPLTAERLFGWHAGLFPTGYSGISRITVAGWRRDETGPMEVVSGAYGHQKVHFQAPPADRLEAETAAFLAWLDADTPEPGLVKAGLAHLWFVTLHPFDDGNGRIARAIGDLALSRAEHTHHRFYSLSAQIQRDPKNYYAILERTQRGGLDVTDWLTWFLDTVAAAVDTAHAIVDKTTAKAEFWRTWRSVALSPRQTAMINRLLDGFNGKLTTKKWAVITKTSQDSALRDINELVALGLLRRSTEGGRSTSYELVSNANSASESGSTG
ncbi:Fic family protein [Nocardia camponoti]|uniref:Cell division protein Fic n=1 Tax=Nocardia camponoti TaxID=1616106 RepID=A0A917QN72_9NOCA|nr:Fic family protein [Nocardia camponoti]GGK58206.1 cell division protein Fic [Nocardia camponoti]